MFGRLLLVLLAALAPAFCQSTCEGTQAWSPCEFRFEISANEAAAHPSPYTDVELRIEFRSPHFKTYLMPAFWAGGRTLVVRFVPTEGGQWLYRITSNLTSLEGQQGSFNATDSDAPGYIHPAEVHHWITETKKPHLWYGWVIDEFPTASEELLDLKLATAEANKFTHLRVTVFTPKAFKTPDLPDTAYWDALDQKMLAIHKRRIAADLVFAHNPDELAKCFPDWQTRKRYLRYLIARYSALNITWGGVEEFEGHLNARALLKETGLVLKELDPYNHPRSTNARLTSSPFLADGWMNFVIDHSNNDQIGAVEHQFYHVPFVGVTKSARLWNATVNDQYPEIEGDPGPQAKSWFDFMADTRHWELEPYFDVDNARAIALEGIEYIVLAEKPGPIEVEVEKHGYDVSWLNPLTGEQLAAKKYHGEHYTGAIPDASHPWILLIAREGRKEAMLKSVRFASRDVPPIQDIEQGTPKVPFQIVSPPGDNIPATVPVPFAAKLTRETRATRSMQYVWSGEVVADGQGARIIGTGATGSFQIPPDVALKYPAVLSLRLQAINANGKAYEADKVYTLTK